MMDARANIEGFGVALVPLAEAPALALPTLEVVRGAFPVPP